MSATSEKIGEREAKRKKAGERGRVKNNNNNRVVETFQKVFLFKKKSARKFPKFYFLTDSFWKN